MIERLTPSSIAAGASLKPRHRSRRVELVHDPRLINAAGNEHDLVDRVVLGGVVVTANDSLRQPPPRVRSRVVLEYLKRRADLYHHDAVPLGEIGHPRRDGRVVVDRGREWRQLRPALVRQVVAPDHPRIHLLSAATAIHRDPGVDGLPIAMLCQRSTGPVCEPRRIRLMHPLIRILAISDELGLGSVIATDVVDLPRDRIPKQVFGEGNDVVARPATGKYRTNVRGRNRRPLARLQRRRGHSQRRGRPAHERDVEGARVGRIDLCRGEQAEVEIEVPGRVHGTRLDGEAAGAGLRDLRRVDRVPPIGPGHRACELIQEQVRIADRQAGVGIVHRALHDRPAMDQSCVHRHQRATG